MDKLIFTSMGGAAQNLQAQAIHAHNLANIDTVGFKADLQRYQSVEMTGPGFDVRTFSVDQTASSSFETGPMITTGRNLDLAIQGEGWFAVQDATGAEAFTRAGELFVDEFGFVKTKSGHNLMGNAGPIILPEYENLLVGSDGVISVQGLGQTPDALTEVDRIKLVNPPLDSIEKRLDGLFQRRDGALEVPAFEVRVATGVLEGSNVSAVGEMMGILEAARQFELQVKMMKKAEEMDQASNQLLRLN